jgi:hypothetical protein
MNLESRVFPTSDFISETRFNQIDRIRIRSLIQTTYRFFHPPRCPGAPPVERGEGPNSGPDWRESVGWKILLPVRGPLSSDEGLFGEARSGR